MTTQVAAGRIEPNTSPCARATSSQCSGDGDEHPRAHDVLGRRARLVERGDDDLEAAPRLLVRVVGRRRAVRHHRRRSRDVHVRAGDDRAREARDGLVRGTGGDEAPLHRG